MDSELAGRGLTVSESIKETYGREDGNDKSRPLSYTEIFEQACPKYMAMGMTYDQFWNGPNEMCAAVRKAYKLRREMENEKAWIQGLYVYDAICAVAPVLIPFSKAKKPEPYAREPFDFYGTAQETSSVERKEQRSDNKAKAVMEVFMTGINKRFEEQKQIADSKRIAEEKQAAELKRPDTNEISNKEV